MYGRRDGTDTIHIPDRLILILEINEPRSFRFENAIQLLICRKPGNGKQKMRLMVN